MLMLGVASVLVFLLGLMAAPVAHAQTIKLGVLTPLSVPGDANAGKLISRGA